uniref:Uncharacterized protein n=1 Tax=Arundo donax TaxID=35708 RepID=A0A0A9BWK7_ARUDO
MRHCLTKMSPITFYSVDTVFMLLIGHTL